jgi:hypothetical protein
MKVSVTEWMLFVGPVEEDADASCVMLYLPCPEIKVESDSGPDRRWRAKTERRH